MPPTKIPKPVADYRSGGIPGFRCHDCVQMEKIPGTCHLVEGQVERNDVCDYFEADRTASRIMGARGA